MFFKVRDIDKNNHKLRTDYFEPYENYEMRCKYIGKYGRKQQQIHKKSLLVIARYNSVYIVVIVRRLLPDGHKCKS